MIGRTHTMVVIVIAVVVVLVLGFVLHIYLGSFDPMMVVVVMVDKEAMPKTIIIVLDVTKLVFVYGHYRITLIIYNEI